MISWILLALFFGVFGFWLTGRAKDAWAVGDHNRVDYFCALTVLSWVSGAVCALFALLKVFS